MKRIILLLGLLARSFLLTADHHTEGEMGSRFFNPGVRIGMIADGKNWDFLSRVTLDFPGDPELLTVFTAGGYYRLHRNLKGGAFYTLSAEKETAHLVTLDVTPRFQVPGGNRTNLVASVKTRYTYNFNTSGQTLFLLPGVTWFIMENRQPRYILNGSWGLYPSLEGGGPFLQDQGPWIDVMYRASSRFSGELGGEYLINRETLSLRLGVIYTFPL